MKIQFNKDIPDVKAIENFAKTMGCFRIPELLIEKSENIYFFSFDEIPVKLSIFFREFISEFNNIWISAIGEDGGESSVYLYEFDGHNEFEICITKGFSFLNKFTLLEQWRFFKNIGFDNKYIRFSLSEYNSYIKCKVLDQRIPEEEYVNLFSGEK